LSIIALVDVFLLRFYYSIVFHISYRTNAMVLWAVASVLLFSQLSEKRRSQVWPLVWLLFLVVNVVSYVTYVPEVIERRKHLQGMAFNQIHNDVGLGGARNTELSRYIAGLTKLM